MQRTERGSVASTIKDIKDSQVAKISKTFQYGDKTITLETGEIARQAGGAVMVSCDGTMVLCTAVASKTQREG